jgi:tripartite-type tricarboxylate transporter receptor subunit TctC
MFSLWSSTLSRRCAAIAAVGAISFLGLTTSTVSAQEAATAYPSKPIRILVPFPPGGAADIFARFIGDKLTHSWGQPVLVENRPGGGGQVATQATVRAPNDGYNLLVVTVGHAVNPHLYTKIPYDTEKDLRPVARLATLPSVLVVNNAVPVRSVAELVARAKSQPNKLNYASSGNASTSHVAGAMLASLAKIEIMHIPYKGSAPAITDLIGGQVDMIIDPLLSSAQQIKAGKLRALAVTTAKRSALVPDLPTLAEAGISGYDFSSWFILLAPSGVPDPIVKKINDEITRIMATPETLEKYIALGAEPGQGTPQELQAFLSSEIKRYAAVVKAAGMRAD